MFICFILILINLADAENGTCGETSSDCSWQYDSNTKKLSITGNGKMSNYTSNSMPWYNFHYQILTVNIEGVTSIGNNAFDGCSLLQSIIIPNSVISIGDSAFAQCKSLQIIAIPNSVTSIGSEAFFCCESLQSITIPNSVTSIGDGAFVCCKLLKSITIPNSVTSIGDGAFRFCTSLQSIAIPNSVISIGIHAFESCTSLQSITIPNSVTSIGSSAFYSCTSLQSITIPNNVTSIGSSAFYSCTSLQSITIPNSVTSIGSSAFYSCTSLQNIIIPNSVTSIREDVFEYCTSLQNITIPNSVTSIGYYAFKSCTSLQSIIIPDNVTSIGSSAFRSCTSLQNIIIPNSVTSIEYQAFESCTSLQSIVIPDSVTSIRSSAFRSCTSLQDITIPNSVTFIGDYAFYNCTSLQSITIPNSVTSIGSSAFSSCTSLQSITIPNSVTSIGEDVFGYCTTLQNITIPNSVTSIGYYAFKSCTSLQSITIPNSVTSIEYQAFSSCTSLQSITIPFTSKLNNIYSSAFSDCNLLTTLVIEGSGSMNDYNESDYRNAPWVKLNFPTKRIVIGNGITSIGDNAFRSCTSLQNITIPDSVTSIRNYAFYNCTSLNSISGSFNYFGSHSFENSGIEGIVIGNNSNEEVYIDEFAFSSCNSLKSVIIKPRFKFNPNNSTQSCSIQSNAFFNCPNMETFIIDGYVDEVKEYAFDFNGTNQVNFQYNSYLPPQKCSSIDPNNITMLLPIFSENIPLIKVAEYYESNVFCSCDKYGCPIQYVNNNDYIRIKESSVPIKKSLDENSKASYCKNEKESEVNFYALCDTCSCNPYSEIDNELNENYSNYSKVVITINDVDHYFRFGEDFDAIELVVNSEQQITSLSNIIFYYLLHDYPLTINSSYPTSTLKFLFNIGNSPTRIFGNTNCLKIVSGDFGYYSLQRQRTFFGNAINSTTCPHLDFYSNYFDYGISSFGDKFESTSSNVVKVSCGGMYRYYSYNPFEIQINSIIATCNKTFNENDDDDFDSFIVTSKLSLLTENNSIFLTSSNIIVESINDYYNQYIFTYPNMFYKYNSTVSTNIYLYGTNERIDKIEINFGIDSKYDQSSSTIMEIQNEDKTLSTFIISTSKQITDFSFNTFNETETVKSQVMIIGLENQVISTTYPMCETLIRKPSFEQCYSCKEGSYMENGICVKETQHCLRRINSECIYCEEGYYVSNGTCQEILNTDTNCLKSVNNTYCCLCKDGYYLKEGNCEMKDVNCLKYEGNICLKCQIGYKLKNNTCEQGIDSHCCYESDQCIECSDGYTLNGNSCILKDENKNGINEIIYCDDGYYIENGTCNQCVNSSYCVGNHQLNCLEGYYNDNNTCISKTCEIKDENGKCEIEIKKCKDNLIVNGRCVECENGYYPNIKGECTTQIENCNDQNSFGCQRCSDGYYLDSNLQCQNCSNECVTCIKSSDYCLSCGNSKYLSNHTCLEIEGLSETCEVVLLDGSGCAICKSGYFKQEKGCEPCQVKCKTCNRNTTCLECNKDYFRDNTNDCVLKRVIVGCEVEITEDGCNRCKDGYYKYKSNQCKECSGGCFTCLNEKECSSCKSGFVLSNNTCVSYHQIDYCIEARHSKCSKCLILFAPSSDGTYCSIHIDWWMIVIVSLICLAIFSLFLMIIYYIIKSCTKRKQKKKMRKNVTIFKLKKSSMSFIDLGDNVVVNTNEIIFNEGKQLPVNKEVITKVCIGNKSKEKMKIQITMKETNSKYSIEAIPNIIIINKGEVCEFDLKIKMLCTCKLKDKIMIVSKPKHKKKEIIKSVSFEAESEMSTRIDPDEIIEEKKLGEGSFGIVYLGTFRGNKVAIKKMKEMKEETLEEFEKEVSMLK